MPSLTSRAAIVAVLAAAVVTAAPTPAIAAFPGANGRIVFGVGDLDDPFEFTTAVQPHQTLFTAKADGSDVRQLSDGLGLDEDAAWSPDGRHVVFGAVRYRADFRAVGGVVIVDGLGRVESAWQCHCDRPSWSADGKRLVVETRELVGTGRGTHTQVDLSVVDGAGRTLRRLTEDRAEDRWPAWSPRGDLIAFESTRGQSFEGSDIYLVRPDGTGLRRLTHANGTHPTWSPDGRWIAFSGNLRSDRPPQILAVPVEGGAPITLSTDPQRNDVIPVWSPDGTQIAYAGTFDFAVHEYVQRVASLPKASTSAVASRTPTRCMRLHRGKLRRMRTPANSYVTAWQSRGRTRHPAVKLCRSAHRRRAPTR